MSWPNDFLTFRFHPPAFPEGRQMAIEVVLYSRRNCCLCDDAEAILTTAGLSFEVVDIDADPELRALYNECVPVVAINGKERFRGRIDPLLLHRSLVGIERENHA
jgi:glutaredoxin